MNHQFSSIPSRKKIYVASDFHLGAPDPDSSRIRELKIARWLSEIEDSAHGVILAGDVFDFWFEYKTVVPKGFLRLFGKLAEMADSGISIMVFAGNHDLWLEDYLISELNASIFHKPISFQMGKNKIMIGHGDGLGPGDRKFKFIKKIFTAGINKRLFRWLHPDIGVKVANLWSDNSRLKNLELSDPFLGENEPLFRYCESIEKTDHHDYYLFGHRHLLLDMNINTHSKYLNLGDWISFFTYAEIDNETVTIRKFEN